MKFSILLKYDISLDKHELLKFHMTMIYFPPRKELISCKADYRGSR